MRFSQFQHHLLDLRRRLVSMPLRRSALLPAALQAHCLISPQPHISGFARDLISLAQLRHRSLPLLILEYKPQLLFHYTALSPWHALFLLAPAFWSQCQVSARSILSGICPVCTFYIAPPGGSCFVANKRVVSFDRTVTERSTPSFRLVSGSNRVLRGRLFCCQRSSTLLLFRSEANPSIYHLFAPAVKGNRLLEHIIF